MILIFTFDHRRKKRRNSRKQRLNPRTMKRAERPASLIIGHVKSLTIGEIVHGIVFLRGEKRDSFTAFDLSTTPPTLLRRDYALNDIREAGGNVPKMYFDELGNMRGESDQIIMEGPLGDVASGGDTSHVIWGTPSK